jgi:zinc/manganese transport system ATP-binding protein
MPPALTLADVTLCHGPTEAVSGLTGSFAPGSLTAVIGPNGAGKTTLLHALAGLHKPRHGLIERGGLAMADIALLPQSGHPDRRFPLTCRDVAAQGLYPRLGALRAAGPQGRSRVSEALVAVGLQGMEERSVAALSAGQFQRLLFARLMVQDAQVLLLDEPFNAIDASTVAALLVLLRRWHQDGRTIVAVLHDMELVEQFFPSTLLLAREAVAWGDTALVLTSANRRRARLIPDDWSLVLEAIAPRPAALTRSAA